MTHAKKLKSLNFGLIFASAVFGFALMNQLPDLVPTRFDVNGVADKFSPKFGVLVLMPFLALFSTLLMNFLAKANREFFQQEKNQEAVAGTNFAITTLLLVIHVGQILVALNPETFKNFSFFSLAFGAFFLLCVGPMKKMGRNMLLGIRVPWTLRSDEVWNATHKFTAKIMMPLGLALVVASPLTKSPLLIFGIIAVSFILPIFYSYKLSKNS